MTHTYLRNRLYEIEGLSQALRYEIHNIVTFRQNGDLGGFEKAKAKTLHRVKIHQPVHLEAVRKILDTK